MRRAIKYPLIQDETPIKKSEKLRARSEAAASELPIKKRAMGDAKTKIARLEAAAINIVSENERRIIFLTPRRLPKISSSATRRVTAVEIPPVAKVATST